MDNALLVSRALHFTATVLATGVVFFRALVESDEQHSASYYRQLGLIFWCSLTLAFVSGAAWLIAVSASIADAPWSQALADGTTLTVLTDTQFGEVWLARLVAGILLATSVGFSMTMGSQKPLVEIALAAVFAGGIAFSGHAGATPGPAGDTHLISDILHVIAASAWVGGLVPYALFLSATSRNPSEASTRAVQQVTRRFSNLGIVAVLTILATGIVNTLNLVGSAHALTHTDYGRLLSIKVALFFVMVAFASINRFALTPRLSDRGAVRAIVRNSLIEASLGLAILGIVAVLGTMPPAVVENLGMHH
ncbi:MAG: copper homeostasis membrane protein CopD [Proteobacteria bacterium]|nr:copper homeostasis membrane protein CopD [Pseudomonadota bacterium]